MSKPNTKKMLTVLISVAMVFSALAILSLTAEPAYAATGSISLDPTVFSHSATSTIVLANGGTFGSGATVKFYASSTTSFTSGSTVVGTYTLTSGTTSLSNAAVTFNPSLLAAGTWYIAASDDSGSTFTSSVSITVSSLNPTISLSPTSVQPGTSVTVSGSGWDSGASLELYLNYASGTVLIGSFTTSDLGSQTFSVPKDLPGSATGVTYDVVAQETSSSDTNYGITADSSFTLKPSITVSPISISGATSSSFTATGHGFPASDSFSASTSLNNKASIQVNGVDAILSAFSSDSTGSFSVSVTGLVSAISSYGVKDISATDSGGTLFSNVGTIIVSVPNPTNLGFTYSVTATTGSTYNVGDSVTATVWNLPASQTVDLYLGSTAAGTMTTDNNGAAQITTTVPALAGATYTPKATVPSMHLVVESSSLSSVTISPDFSAADSAGTSLTSTTAEYVPTTGMVTVSAYGLNPTTSSYDFKDSLVATSGVGAGGLVASVSVGTESSSSGEFTPASNGTLIFTYSPGYTISSTTTGSTGTITSSVSGVDPYDALTYSYDAIGKVTISAPALSSSSDVMQVSTSGQHLTLSGLIPYTANLYPGVTSDYNVFMGSSELTLTFTNPSSVTTSGTSINSGDTSITFTSPSTSGVYDVNITYNGNGYTSDVASQAVAVSTPGSSGGSGTLVLVATTNGWTVVGFGYDINIGSFNLYYTKDTGVTSGVGETLGTSTGAFVDTVTLGTAPTEAAGTYEVFTQGTLAGSTYDVYTSYSISTNLTLSSYSGNVGTSGITLTGSGLESTTYYNVYFGTSLLNSYTGSQLAGGSETFTVPVVPKGDYTVSVKQVGSSTSTESAGFKVKANSAITLSTSSQYAFPGQLVTFSASGFTAPGFGFTNLGATEYYAVIEFNGTPVATVPASFSSGTLSGSFINPNNATGAYYKLTITGYEQTSKVTSLLSGSIMNQSFIQAALTGSPSDFFGLVSGNGALLAGISSGQIATLEADINSTVSTSLTVPISQLNAAITSINGAVATLKTTVGNITTDLSTINATVSSIKSGQATVLTDLGSISTSLASLNASLVAFNNNVVTINTTLGQVVTSLGSIQTQVTANGNGIATVKTAIGTVQGQIVSQNGNITTVKTSLGTLAANVSKIQSQTSGFSTLEIFLIVIIVLVLITLVISFLAVNAANKAARKITEDKKQ